jgi:CheY-like chemotaxis protein
MHILLIDDSSSTRSLLRTLVNSGHTGQIARHEISEAASGEEALQKVGSGEINIPDLIIVDINMAGMSGYDLCREFRLKHPTGSDMRPYIIVVTANEGVDVINEALDSGANDYMPKPVNAKILQVRLRVAERILSHVNPSGPGNTSGAPGSANISGSGRVILDPKAPLAGSSDSARENLIAAAIENADAPMAILDVAGEKPSFIIAYANTALSLTTQYTREQLEGKSLAELEAWTPEFLDLVLGFIDQTAIVSYTPLWSHTRQNVPVHLSFYPIRAEHNQVNQYLVVHHF